MPCGTHRQIATRTSSTIPFVSTSVAAQIRTVAFGGGGVHFCLGASLARRELTTLLEVLLERARHIELAGAPSYTPLGIFNPIMLFLAELPVRLA